MTTKFDSQTRISGIDRGSFIFVDNHDENVWISSNVNGGHIHVVISKEAAKDMIAALIRIVEAE